MIMDGRLTRQFYLRDSTAIAPELIGKKLIRAFPAHSMGGVDFATCSGTIIELEIYPGIKDRASHVWGGKRTKRTEIEYEEGGHVYIYLVYGMYWQFNITTGPVDNPQCILIRAVDPDNGELNNCNGPGKVCSYFQIDGSWYGENLATSKRLWIEDAPIELSMQCRSARVNIDYAGPVWARKKLRIYDKRYERALAKIKSRYA